MHNNKNFKYIKPMLIGLLIAQAVSTSVLAKKPELKKNKCKTYIADRIFDGHTLFAAESMAVVINGEQVYQIAPAASVQGLCKHEVNLEDSTILPGFIESHAHMLFQNVPADIVLKHGITTLRDVGSRIENPTDGIGALRYLNTGPIIQAEHGFPLNVFGGHGDHGDHHAANIAVVATDEDEARTHVQHIANSGAVGIKVSMEAGGEPGAPWSGGHGHGTGPALPWPMLSPEILEAIVDEAHSHDLPVIAHAGEQTGFDLAVAAGVDEFAHIPCAAISESSLQDAVDAEIIFNTTLDTLSSCHGILHNTHILTAKGATFIYGSEVAHNDVPWGINAEELHQMLHNTAGHDGIDFGDVIRVIKSATSMPGSMLGELIGEPLLGTLAAGAPADIIAVPGNAFEKFKHLEYPRLVISGGQEVVNDYLK